ncbi:MAG: 2-aminoethylphosphonate--pyruvate transaminase [Balneolaceae bacterium]|nr:2-aminoethylphosphonate--pyruvate transaminase [Balneolaceae bacterium]
MSDQIERNILLNPGPATTARSVKEALVVNDICPREEEFGTVLTDISEGLLKIGNGSEQYQACLFAASGTGAVEAMLTSALGADEKVLIITNGAYGIRMEKICDAFSRDFETICRFGEYPQVDRLRQKLQEEDFTHLAAVHHETSTGMMNPLEEISHLCREFGVKLIVDAMSSFGAYPIDLDRSGISYLAASSNKCIHGMPGLSFVIFHTDCVDEIEKNNGNFYFDMYRQWSYLKQKGQLRFTPPVQVCYSFREAIKDTLEETVENRWQRYRQNWQVLYDGIRQLGFRFYLPMEQQSHILMAVALDGVLHRGFDHFHDYLYGKNITVYPGVIPETDTFRMAVIGDLYPRDLHYVVEQIEQYLDAADERT